MNLQSFEMEPKTWKTSLVRASEENQGGTSHSVGDTEERMTEDIPPNHATTEPLSHDQPHLPQHLSLSSSMSTSSPPRRQYKPASHYPHISSQASDSPNERSIDEATQASRRIEGDGQEANDPLSFFSPKSKVQNHAAAGQHSTTTNPQRVDISVNNNIHPEMSGSRSVASRDDDDSEEEWFHNRDRIAGVTQSSANEDADDARGNDVLHTVEAIQRFAQRQQRFSGRTGASSTSYQQYQLASTSQDREDCSLNSATSSSTTSRGTTRTRTSVVSQGRARRLPIQASSGPSPSHPRSTFDKGVEDVRHPLQGALQLQQALHGDTFRVSNITSNNNDKAETLSPSPPQMLESKSIGRHTMSSQANDMSTAQHESFDRRMLPTRNEKASTADYINDANKCITQSSQQSARNEDGYITVTTNANASSLPTPTVAASREHSIPSTQKRLPHSEPLAGRADVKLYYGDNGCDADIRQNLGDRDIPTELHFVSNHYLGSSGSKNDAFSSSNNLQTMRSSIHEDQTRKTNILSDQQHRIHQNEMDALLQLRNNAVASSQIANAEPSMERVEVEEASAKQSESCVLSSDSIDEREKIWDSDYAADYGNLQHYRPMQGWLHGHCLMDDDHSVSTSGAMSNISGLTGVQSALTSHSPQQYLNRSVSRSVASGSGRYGVGTASGRPRLSSQKVMGNTGSMSQTQHQMLQMIASEQQWEEGSDTDDEGEDRGCLPLGGSMSNSEQNDKSSLTKEINIMGELQRRGSNLLFGSAFGENNNKKQTDLSSNRLPEYENIGKIVTENSRTKNKSSDSITTFGRNSASNSSTSTEEIKRRMSLEATNKSIMDDAVQGMSADALRTTSTPYRLLGSEHIESPQTARTEQLVSQQQQQQPTSRDPGLVDPPIAVRHTRSSIIDALNRNAARLNNNKKNIPLHRTTSIESMRSSRSYTSLMTLDRKTSLLGEAAQRDKKPLRLQGAQRRRYLPPDQQISLEQKLLRSSYLGEGMEIVPRLYDEEGYFIGEDHECAPNLSAKMATTISKRNSDTSYTSTTSAVNGNVGGSAVVPSSTGGGGGATSQPRSNNSISSNTSMPHPRTRNKPLAAPHPGFECAHPTPSSQQRYLRSQSFPYQQQQDGQYSNADPDHFECSPSPPFHRVERTRGVSTPTMMDAPWSPPPYRRSQTSIPDVREASKPNYPSQYRRGGPTGGKFTGVEAIDDMFSAGLEFVGDDGGLCCVVDEYHFPIPQEFQDRRLLRISEGDILGSKLARFKLEEEDTEDEEDETTSESSRSTQSMRTAPVPSTLAEQRKQNERFTRSSTDVGLGKYSKAPSESPGDSLFPFLAGVAGTHRTSRSSKTFVPSTRKPYSKSCSSPPDYSSPSRGLKNINDSSKNINRRSSLGDWFRSSFRKQSDKVGNKVEEEGMTSPIPYDQGNASMDEEMGVTDNNHKYMSDADRPDHYDSEGFVSSDYDGYGSGGHQSDWTATGSTRSNTERRCSEKAVECLEVVNGAATEAAVDGSRSTKRQVKKINRKVHKAWRSTQRLVARNPIGFHLITMNRRRLKTFLLFFMLPVWCSIWTVAYSKMEGWNHFESFYFVIQIFTTVGFGDFKPYTDLGMVLFPFASMGGITLSAACIAHVAVYLSSSKSWVKVKNLVLLFFFFIASSSLLFMWLENWTWGQSMFFLYNCATTTGLSEEVPETTAGRVCFCFIMIVVFSIFTTLVKLMVDHMKQGSDAENTDAEDMTRAQLKRMIRSLFDTTYAENHHARAHHHAHSMNKQTSHLSSNASVTRSVTSHQFV